MAEAEPGKRKSRLWFLLLIPVLAAVGIVYWLRTSGRESTDDAQIDGRIHAVSPRVAGHVIELPVTNNQYIEQGAVIAKLDPRDFQVAVEKARADLAEAEASLRASTGDVPIVRTTSTSRTAGAEAGVRGAEAAVNWAKSNEQSARAKADASRAHVAEVQAELDRLNKDLERYRSLVAKDEISQQQFDTAAAAVKAAQARLDAARAQQAQADQDVRTAQSEVERQSAALAQAHTNVEATTVASNQIEVSQARSTGAAARVEQMRAQLADAELKLGYTTVVAPVSGIINKRGIEVGQGVQANQPIVAIVEPTDVWVTANFKETQLDHMRVGQAATIEVDAYDGRKVSGHIESFSPATGARFSLLPPENASGNFVKIVQRVPVRIAIDKGQDPQHDLRQGMSVEVTVHTH